MTQESQFSGPPNGDSPNADWEQGFQNIEFSESARPNVLRALEAGRAPLARVILRVPDRRGAAAPLIDESRSDAATTVGARVALRLLEEIVRDDSGVLFKAHDDDLGRDLLVKVPYAHVAQEHALLERFLASARIAAQLEHPGIAPVHELGMLADGRPYYASQPVQGCTLSALLAERGAIARDTRRFLSILASVSHALAYAHARGVVHRDIDPAKIMVGEHGEAWIVDWSQCALLNRAASPALDMGLEPTPVLTSGVESSRSGSVLGTPSAMSPERARGGLAALDERSDVYSLGAILCSMITGEAPYPGGPTSLVERARAGHHGPFDQRLASSGAHPDLIDLCRACLSPVPAERPRDAGVFASELSLHLLSAEKRARSAQENAERSRKRFVAQRRLILLVAALLLLMVGGGGGGYGWVAAKNRQRLADGDLFLLGAMEEAGELRVRAIASASIADWEVALESALNAQLQLASHAVSPQVSERAATLTQRIEADLAAARARAALLARNELLLRSLEEVRQPDKRTDAEAYTAAAHAVLARQYEAAFAAAGFDLIANPTADVVSELTASGIAIELAPAIDEWAAACRDAALGTQAVRGLHLALAIDPDPTRSRLRGAQRFGKPANLLELVDRAGAPQLQEQPLATLLLLAHGLDRVGALAQSVAVLRAAVAAHPGSFASQRALARGLLRLDVTHVEQALGHYRAALALRPQSLELRHELGSLCLHALEDAQMALDFFQEALERAPSDAHIKHHVAEALQELGRFREAVDAHEAGLRITPEGLEPRLSLARAVLASGEPARAQRILELALKDDSGNARLHDQLARTHEQAGDFIAAIAAWRSAVQHDPNHGPAYYALAKALDERGDLPAALTAWVEAVRCAPENAGARMGLGVALFLSDDTQGALVHLSAAARLEPLNPRVQHSFGRVLHAAGEHAKGLSAYARAVELDPAFGQAHFDHGSALLEGGNAKDAIHALRAALRCRPDHPETLCNLGLALLEAGGQDREALGVLQRGHELGSRRADWSHPSQDWVQTAETRVREAAQGGG